MKHFIPAIIFFSILWSSFTSPDQGSDYRESLKGLIERADSGDAKALYNLAYLHDTGFDTIPVDSARSTALYLLSAEKGYAPAQNFIGFRYYRGEIVKKDIDSALYWIRKAADAGDLTAAANLGYLLTDSKDIPHDEEEALRWLGEAVKAGGIGPQIKYITLIEPQWSALEADSALNLGLEFYLDKSQILGTKLFEIAAAKGSPRALTLLGDAYSKGLGVPYDHYRSTQYFYQAAMAGDPSAWFIIAELLDFFPDTQFGSETTDTEIHSSQYWYEKAREAGIYDSEQAYRKLYSLKKFH